MSENANSFLVAGDTVMFLPSLGGPALITQPAMTIVTSKSKNTATFRGITTEGDESTWILTPCTYINPPFVIVGMGTLKISKLHKAHVASKIQSDGKKVLLVGDMSTSFDTEFSVIKPAQQPPPPAGNGAPDSVMKFSGKGYFLQAAPSNAYNND